MCYSFWYNAPTMLLTAHRPATLWVHYTTSCNTQSSAPEGGQNNCPKQAELTGIINMPLLLHLVSCLYYLYQSSARRGAWMFVCCDCCVLSGRGLCDELITVSEESYRLWCVVECDLETS